MKEKSIFFQKYKFNFSYASTYTYMDTQTYTKLCASMLKITICVGI